MSKLRTKCARARLLPSTVSLSATGSVYICKVLSIDTSQINKFCLLSKVQWKFSPESFSIQSRACWEVKLMKVRFLQNRDKTLQTQGQLCTKSFYKSLKLHYFKEYQEPLVFYPNGDLSDISIVCRALKFTIKFKSNKK